MEDNSMGDNAMEDNAMENSFMENNSMGDNSIDYSINRNEEILEHSGGLLTVNLAHERMTLKALVSRGPISCLL